MHTFFRASSNKSVHKSPFWVGLFIKVRDPCWGDSELDRYHNLSPEGKVERYFFYRNFWCHAPCPRYMIKFVGPRTWFAQSPFDPLEKGSVYNLRSISMGVSHWNKMWDFLIFTKFLESGTDELLPIIDDQHPGNPESIDYCPPYKIYYFGSVIWTSNSASIHFVK